jgi:RimJ/RimL family protein N-acetyltransferase
MMTPVTLTTDRLVLRTPEMGDFDAVEAYARSPRARFTGGQQSDRMVIWRSFLGTAGHWALKGFGYFTVLAGGTPVGRVGVLEHIAWQEPELGWHLFAGHEGQGYATEAARAVRDWAKAERGLGPLISYIHPENAASRRVAERLGAHLERETVLLDNPVQIWRHPEGQA